MVGDHNVENDEGQEQFMQIKSAKIHENYDDYTVDYDVCVITVSMLSFTFRNWFDKFFFSSKRRLKWMTMPNQLLLALKQIGLLELHSLSLDGVHYQ